MSSKLKAGAITELRAEVERQIEKNKRLSGDLASHLCSVVPSSFSVWLDEAGGKIIENLLEYGIASRKYRRNEGSSYGYEDLNEFEKRFEELRIAWKGVVGIDISWDGDYRFEITFTAI